MPYGIEKDAAIEASMNAQIEYFAEKEKKYFDEIERAVDNITE